MDTREVFSPADKLSKRLILFGLGLLVVVAGVAVIAARSISSPIRELTEVSRVISSGDLSARAEVSTGDEVGELAYSFNQMTDSLVQAKAKVEEERATIEEQAKLLEKANHELDSFVYTVSHDLRAPLRGIEAFASFLEEDYKNKLDEEGRDHINEIVKGVSRMNNFIEDLLTLSRISRIKNPYEDVDINKLIADTVERIKFDIERYKVDLDVQKGFPVVRCDRIKINEAFLNLINNAIKYSSKNKKENPKVRVGYDEKAEAYEFYVKDNGIGIDPKDHDKVFEIFKRIKTEEEFEGTGAGLSIVKKIVDDHRGKIWVVSELGKGAEFHFTIPKGL